VFEKINSFFIIQHGFGLFDYYRTQR
jgi:hypothetical protein